MHRIVLPGLALTMAATAALAQTTPDPIAATTAREHAAELAMLHIKALRPCDTPYAEGTPQRAAAVGCRMVNFDEAKANPYPLPDPLRAADGTHITSRAQWFKHRAELKEIFDREVFGRIPAHTPGVTWRVDDIVRENFGAIPVVTQHLTGHVDNSRDPAITVDIKVAVSVPETSKGKHVPAIIAFTYPPRRSVTAPADPAPDYREQIARRGWALVAYVNNSVQPDNGAGLYAGIIGLMNKGALRKPDDWGALAAWSWGASRVLDYLQGDPDIDARRVGVFGHSRNGKAALLAMVNDPRFAIGYISSSGSGGAVPYRRNYGESIANLGNVLYYWMAPNFMKYAAADATPNDVPVDTNELIALVAPRPLFLGGGIKTPKPVNGTDLGDLWIDPVGSFKAEAAASPVYELMGAKGTGTDVAPEPLHMVDSGALAFRRHDQGHTPAPNWPYFLDFAAHYFKS